MTAPSDSRTSRLLHDSYLVGLAVQALIGGSQLVGAVVLQLAIRFGWLEELARITQHELTETRRDPPMLFLLNAAHDFSIHRETFWSLYLVGHGVLNLGVVIALLARRRWAHPVSIAVLTGFVLYQLYRYAYSGAPVLVGLSLFDAVVIALVWREWRVTRARP